MLGAAIGDELHCCDWVGKKVTKKAVPLLDNLSLLEDPQTEFILLNYCINFCRMVFFIRTTPSHLIQAATLQYDTLVLRALERMVGRSIGDPAVSRAVLSIKNGGLGIRSSTAHSTAAYISSFNTCRQLVGEMMNGPPSVEPLTQSVDMYNSAMDDAHLIDTGSVHKSQKLLSTAIDEVGIVRVMDHIKNGPNRISNLAHF